MPTEVEFTAKDQGGITFEFPLDAECKEDDFLLFSYVHPYNLQDIEISCKRLADVSVKHPDLLSYTEEVIANSIEGRPIKLLTLTSPDAAEDAPVIFMTSRVHSGETPASFMLQGILDMLTDVENP